MKQQKRIILGVTGSIAAYKAADIIRRLTEKGFKVSVVMTKEAEAFITPLTLSTLSGEKVYCGNLENDNAPWDKPHIELGQNADVLLIAPATANIIGKIAHGLADDLLTCITLVTKAPLLIAPAMNNSMYENKAVAENCKTLKQRGWEFIGPVKGKLACGTEGKGHISDVKDIVSAVIDICK